MARGKIKTEMSGTGGGRWTTRREAKMASRKRRREVDREWVREALAEGDDR